MRQWIFVILSIILLACSGVQVDYRYESQNFLSSNVFENASFYIELNKSKKNSPVEPELSYIFSCFRQQLRDCNAEITQDLNKDNDIRLHLTFSKYTTRYMHGKYLTHIDVYYEAFDNIHKRKLDGGDLGFAGASEEDPALANLEAVQKMVKRIVDNKAIVQTLAQLGNDQAGHVLDKLSARLLTNFEQRNSKNGEVRIALLGAPHDPDGVFQILTAGHAKKIGP